VNVRPANAPPPPIRSRRRDSGNTLVPPTSLRDGQIDQAILAPRPDPRRQTRAPRLVMSVSQFVIGAGHRLRAIRVSCPHRITPPENLNLGKESNCTIYAIYFQKTGVGRRSTGKNSLKIIIAPWILWIIAITSRAATPKTAHLLGNLKIFKNENWTTSDRKFRWERPG